MNGKPQAVSTAWRLTVTGEGFTVRDIPPAIYLASTLVGYGQENEDLTQIAVILFDRSLLREGAAIALSYGEDDLSRTELPERLHLISNP